MSDNDMIKVLQLSDGRVFQELEDGTLQPMKHDMDWSRFDALSDDEVEDDALSEVDPPSSAQDDLDRLQTVPNLKRIRARLHLTQEQFADSFQLPLGTVRDWELGRREPDTAARNFLRLIEHNPEMVKAALQGRAHDRSPDPAKRQDATHV